MNIITKYDIGDVVLHDRSCYACKRDATKKKKQPIVISTPDNPVACRHGYYNGIVKGKIVEIKATMVLDDAIDVPLRYITYTVRLVGGNGYAYPCYIDENDIPGYA